jgi:hypothetical protein
MGTASERAGLEVSPLVKRTEPVDTTGRLLKRDSLRDYALGLFDAQKDLCDPLIVCDDIEK